MSSYAAHFGHAGSRLHAAGASSSIRRFTLGSTERKYERSRPFEITHMALDLDVDMKGRAISGTATLEIARRAPHSSEFALDAIAFSISSIEMQNGKSKKALKEGSDYSYDGEQIVLSMPDGFETGTVVIAYRAVPRLGLYFLAPDKEVPDRPHQVWSQCQDEDGRHWFPCQDKPHVKMTYELCARVPNGMTVLSGGALHSKKTPKKGAWEFHYRLDVPTSAYLVTLVIGKFDEWNESVTLASGKEIALRYLVPPGKLAEGKRAFERTGEMIQLLSEKTGVDYRYDSYAQVVVADFIFGGMENATATTMYEHILIDKTASIDIDSHDLVVHEMAHQWFGDLVTCRDWSQGWLNEGFATYWEHVEREYRLGNDEYEHNVTVDLNIYLGEARGNYKRAIVCRDYDEPIDLFDRHLYQKGGLVLHMLRQQLGEDVYWAAVKDHLETHRDSIAETNGLIRIFEKHSGLSLEKFFDQWVYRPGHPELTVKVAHADGLLTIDVEQTQKGEGIAVFELPFEIDVTIGGKTTRHRRVIEERKSSIVVQTKQRPEHVTIDPRYLVTAPIVYRAPADMLRSLLANGEQARARRMAAHALGRRHDPETIEALIGVMKNSKEAWMVRTKAVESLGKIRGAEAEKALLAAASIDHHKVRRAVATALGVVRTPEAEKKLVGLSKDKSYRVTAAAAGALGQFKTPTASKTLLGLLKKKSWSEIVRSGALAALAQSGDDAAVPTLMEWTKYGKPLRARRSAIAALARLGEGKKVRMHLEGILGDKDPHVRSAALSALGSLDDSSAVGAIHALLAHELDGGVRTTAHEVLGDLGSSGISGVKEAKKENQRLKREMEDLRLRIQKLEQLVEDKPKATKVPARKTAAKKTVKKATKKTTSKRKR